MPLPVEGQELTTEKEGAGNKDKATPREEFIGCAAGKYKWDHPVNTAAEPLQEPVINDYSWSDGKKTVTIYVTLPGLDDVHDEDLHSDHDNRSVTFSARIGGHRRTLTIRHLQHEIRAVVLVRKKGKHLVCLKLEKKKEEPWHSLTSDAGTRHSYGGA
eukprot:TRINITY_DN89210_c0_g1_i1.p1 TRINITY_DN89210_c0_g1~~TRINITY_DN89210_c0_g1_i1.p1  ORF type:complete len:158 (-),score=35.49 TRINITY_DN89210_c0_g1_i1:148-621(-)